MKQMKRMQYDFVCKLLGASSKPATIGVRQEVGMATSEGNILVKTINISPK